MFYALPADTVFEAKQRTRRATVYLFLFLAILYIAFFNLLLIAFYAFFHFKEFIQTFPAVPTVAYAATALAVAIAIIHFMMVRTKTLDDMIGEIGARAPDPLDEYHAQFIDIVSELEGATGIRGIRPLVLSIPGSNAFSLQDSKGASAIGVTEGILTRLTRAELSAVAAHEAAHLVHEDARLITTATFLFSVFGKIHEALGSVFSVERRNRTYDADGLKVRVRGGQGTFPVMLLWAISGVGYLVTRLVFTVISREREYYADSDGVAMCKDPLAMAESLYKIANRYRGDFPQSYSALFILNPSESTLDEDEGMVPDLFSNHPPVSKRIDKLLAWAKADLATVQAAVEKEEKQAPPGPQGGPLAGEAAQFMAYRDNQWVGPYNPLQLLSMGFMSPSTWVCPAGGQEVARASDTAELLPLFLKQVQGSVSQAACPRCKVPLVTTPYEGTQVEQCSFCQGYLLRGGVLERLIMRDQGSFSADDVQKARVWRQTQQGPLGTRDHFPAITCPHCKGPMCKAVHSYMTQVVIDRCSYETCGSIWCDGGELETIQMLLKDAKQGPA